MWTSPLSDSMGQAFAVALLSGAVSGCALGLLQGSWCGDSHGSLREHAAAPAASSGTPSSSGALELLTAGASLTVPARRARRRLRSSSGVSSLITVGWTYQERNKFNRKSGTYRQGNGQTFINIAEAFHKVRWEQVIANITESRTTPLRVLGCSG
uniref:Putative secreted protein n=1 Tax=Ixodes ricinus TaxID=34613 RepID=A0A6B0UVP1_IXORI